MKEFQDKKLGAAIRSLRNQRGINQTAFAHMIDSHPGNLSRMERGLEGITIARLDAIAHALRVTIPQLFHLADMDDQVSEESADYSLDIGPEVLLSQVPIVGNTQAGPDRIWEETGHPAGYGEAFLDAPSKDRNAYALRIVGTSMAPRMREGEVILVHPNDEPHPGDEVVVRMKDGETMVKELVYIRDGDVALNSINENHQRIVRSLRDVEFIHVVAGVFRASAVKKRLHR